MVFVMLVFAALLLATQATYPPATIVPTPETNPSGFKGPLVQEAVVSRPNQSNQVPRWRTGLTGQEDENQAVKESEAEDTPMGQGQTVKQMSKKRKAKGDAAEKLPKRPRIFQTFILSTEAIQHLDDIKSLLEKHKIPFVDSHLGALMALRMALQRRSSTIAENEKQYADLFSIFTAEELAAFVPSVPHKRSSNLTLLINECSECLPTDGHASTEDVLDRLHEFSRSFLAAFKVVQSAIDGDDSLVISVKELGGGHGGTVLLAFTCNPLRRVAVKRAARNDPENPEAAEDLKQEARFLGWLAKREDVVKMEDSWDDDEFVFITLEYAGGGSLFALISGGVDERQAGAMARQIVPTIAYIHSLGIVHRDIKPENFLVTLDGFIKICDFGLAGKQTDGEKNLTGKLGTVMFMAPEVLKEQPYNEMVDIWSLGMMFLTLFKPVLRGREDSQRVLDIIQYDTNLQLDPKKYSIDLRVFIQLCLVRNPAYRAPATTLQSTSFVTDGADEQTIKDMITSH